MNEFVKINGYWVEFCKVVKVSKQEVYQSALIYGKGNILKGAVCANLITENIQKKVFDKINSYE